MISGASGGAKEKARLSPCLLSTTGLDAGSVSLNSVLATYQKTLCNLASFVDKNLKKNHTK